MVFPSLSHQLLFIFNTELVVINLKGKKARVHATQTERKRKTEYQCLQSKKKNKRSILALFVYLSCNLRHAIVLLFILLSRNLPTCDWSQVAVPTYRSFFRTTKNLKRSGDWSEVTQHKRT